MRELFILTDGFDDIVVLAAYDREDAIALCERIVGVRAARWSCVKYKASDKLWAIRKVNEWFYSFYHSGREVDLEIVECMQMAIELIV